MPQLGLGYGQRWVQGAIHSLLCENIVTWIFNDNTRQEKQQKLKDHAQIQISMDMSDDIVAVI